MSKLEILAWWPNLAPIGLKFVKMTFKLIPKDFLNKNIKQQSRITSPSIQSTVFSLTEKYHHQIALQLCAAATSSLYVKICWHWLTELLWAEPAYTYSAEHKVLEQWVKALEEKNVELSQHLLALAFIRRDGCMNTESTIWPTETRRSTNSRTIPQCNPNLWSTHSLPGWYAYRDLSIFYNPG